MRTTSTLIKALLGAGAGAGALALTLIAGLEGKRNHAYLDVAGVPTICYGYTHGVKLGDTKTDAECQALLESEVAEIMQRLDRYVDVPLTEPQRASLASFVYNVGEGAFARSTLRKKLNAGDMAGACDELQRWVYAGGKVWQGLVKRRALERWLCQQ